MKYAWIALIIAVVVLNIVADRGVRKRDCHIDIPDYGIQTSAFARTEAESTETWENDGIYHSRGQIITWYDQGITAYELRPHQIEFRDDSNNTVGTLYCENPLRFEGNADASAKLFFDAMVKQWYEMEEAR